MTEERKLPDAIQWHEGMLLAPQHFQQSSFRQEELLHYHLKSTSPFHWGIVKLEIDAVLLIEGIFRVLELEAVMPDGIVVYHYQGGQDDLKIDLTAYADDMAEHPLTIYLAVPAKQTGLGVVKGVLDRYNSVEGAPVADENTGDSELAIPRLVPRLSLLGGPAPSQKYCAFPLAKITYQDESYSRTEYIPPYMTVSTKSELWRMCAEMSRRLREKAAFLSERLNSPALMIRGPLTLENKLLVHAMISNLPALEAHLYTGTCHPYRVYTALCAIAGNVATLGTGLVPPVLTPYNHNDLQASFLEVIAFIEKMIDEGILESHIGIPFAFEAGIFSLRLKKEWIEETFTIGARGRIDMPEENIQLWMDESLIGSAEEIESMKERRIRGARREKIVSDEDLVPPRGITLYKINSDPEFIKPDQKLMILNTADAENQRGPMEMILYEKK